VDFDTYRDTIATSKKKSHVSHVVADTGTWEQKTAMALEDMDEVIRYVRNDHLGFLIPYTLDGNPANYIPDFIAQIDDGHGKEDPLNLIIEVTGERKKDKAAKVMTARGLWVPAVNNAEIYGRWAFTELMDPHNVKNAIRAYLKERAE
jgi:type III restriction enzyme